MKNAAVKNAVAAKTVTANTNSNTTVKENTVNLTAEQLAAIASILNSSKTTVTAAPVATSTEPKAPTATEIAAESSYSARIGRFIGKAEVSTVHHVARAAGFTLTRTGAFVEKVGQVMQASGEVCYAYADVQKPGYIADPSNTELFVAFPDLAKKFAEAKTPQAKVLIAQLAKVRTERLAEKLAAVASK